MLKIFIYVVHVSMDRVVMEPPVPSYLYLIRNGVPIALIARP